MPDLSTLDAASLARIQFAADITFHILFPTISLGLAWILLYFKLRYAGSGEECWLRAYRFWVKVFALSFLVGVASGVTMSVQFGANWPSFMDTVGNIARPLMAYEVLTAFLLEATFLGIMLFGLQRVSDRAHTLATAVTAVATTLSAFWVLALNSWMHTPAGYAMRDGQAYPTDWLAILFSPSLPYRFVHMLLACGLTAAFLVAGLSAYRWRRGDQGPEVKAALATGVRLAAILIPLQILAGHLHGLNTEKHQPAKAAAMAGRWESGPGAPALLFAWPDEKTRGNRFAISLPAFSLSPEPRPGLKDFPGLHPPVAPVFWAFRLMVATGILMLVVSWTACWRLRREGAPTPGLSRALVPMTFAGWVALVAGWCVTEMGRQPWLVHGLLTTACAGSGIPPTAMGLTLAAYLGLYGLLLASFVAVVFRMARRAGDDEKIGERAAISPAIPSRSEEHA